MPDQVLLEIPKLPFEGPGESLEDAVASLLKAPDEGQADADEGEPLEDQDGGSGAGAEAPEGQAERPDEDLAAPDETDSEPNLIEVTLPGGEKIHITPEEAAAGYTRTQDYTRKRQADAEEHRRAMAEVQALREKYIQSLDAMTQALKQMGPPAPPEDLKRTNRGEWAARMLEHQAYHQWVDSLVQEKSRASEEAAREAEAARHQKLLEEWNKAVAAVPAWSDPDAAAKELGELHNFLVSEYGFSPADIESAVTDHRILLLIRDAHLAKAGQKAAAKAVNAKRQAAGAKKLPAGGRRSRAPDEDKRKAVEAAQARFMGSRSVRDAADLLAQLME